MNFNRVVLAGHLTAAPELRTTPAGKACASFSIAYNEQYVVNGEVKKKVNYFPIVVWGKQAEKCKEYLDKGNAVLVEGKISIRIWEDKEGNKHKITEIIASSVHFITTKTQQQQTAPDETIPIDDEPPY